ncbi:hypothetical protein FGG08_000110 [Glutinoglossum americanum]|uniref:Protein kinase domain-containing protein n=1 Tax=Glutinoglossum americanum TaxID=1670608 RepID=A0A9P8IE64_9PEZI|nr:hypothetical protein FGG08_000110 [Glutinoglossum americanum]
MSKPKSPYACFVQYIGLNCTEEPGWSGRGNHVEFGKREDIPLATHEVLGSGGYAVVQKVICQSNDERPLAQKIIRDYRKGLEVVMSEVKHIQQLRHRHLIQLVGTYALGWTLHLLLFPVGQWNLKTFLEELQEANMNRKAYHEFYSLGMFFKCLSGALAYLHNETTPHIKHLDIKPKNIIVRRLAKRQITTLALHGASSVDIDTLYTTPIYAAPEVVQKKPFGRQADIFSMGCVFSQIASVLGGRTLLEYANHRRCLRENIPTIAFEANLAACNSWLQSLRLNAPYRQFPPGESEWWTRLLELIKETLSESDSGRPNCMRIVSSFPPGPCCDVTLENYSLPTEVIPQANDASTSPRGKLQPEYPDMEQLTLYSIDIPTVDALETMDLVPQAQPSISHIASKAENMVVQGIDWSGRGAHVDYGPNEVVPLEQLDVIAIGSSSLVTKVRTTRRGPYIFAKKSLQKTKHLLKLEMLLDEVKMLQGLRHPHIIRLVGTLNEPRFFSLLIYPAADMNLQTFMGSIESFRALPSDGPTSDLQNPRPREASLNKSDYIARKQALEKFFKCLIHGLDYLHSQFVRHKDIKPSNILVQERGTERDYKVYLADFGLSTRVDSGHETQTHGATGHTPMYASPEVLLCEPRGRASDIFSMGCVWLEMYTILLGESLSDFERYRKSPADELDGLDITETAMDGLSSGFAQTLSNVQRWIERLITYCSMHGSLIHVLSDSENFPGLGVSCVKVIEGLHGVEKMLHRNPNRRPDTRALCLLSGTNKCCEGDIEQFKLDDVENSRMACFEVPFERDLKFIGREDVIANISRQFEVQRRIALAGIGGVGKSQIAIEYCYRFRERHPESHVFWIHASTIYRMDQAYKDIAKKLYLLNWNDSNVDTFQLVSSSNGSILITTRDKRVGERLANREKVIIVSPTGMQEAMELLWSKVSQEDSLDKTKSRELLNVLGYLPLAITQAAAYISENSITVGEYLEIFSAEDSEIQDLLSEDLPDIRRDFESRNSVIRTWKVSFDQIRQQMPRAAEILSLMAVLDRQGIPKTLLHRDGERKTKFTTALGALIAFGLVIAEKGRASFEIHRLVQISVRRWLKLQGEMTKWQEEALNILTMAFPSCDYSTWAICEALSPHVQVVARYTFTSDSNLLKRAQLLHNMSSYDETQGRYNLAYEKGLDALFIRENTLGPEHPDTLMSMNNLAVVLSHQGKYETAEEMHRQVLELKEKVLGFEHPDTLMSVNNLGVVFRDQGKYKAAEEMHRQALELEEKVLGYEHPDTLMSISNLASVLQYQGKYEAAEKVNRRALDGREKTLGEDHPDTLTSISNLALSLQYQGEYEAAEKMNRQALDGREKTLGKDHPDTLTSISNLALSLQYQGEYEAAEKMNRQALDGREKTLGKDHPDTLTSISNLALVLQYQGKYEAAEEMNRRVLDGREKMLGRDHPDILTSISNLALSLQYQGKYEAAEEMNRRVLDGREKMLGRDHPDTLTSISNLALLLQYQGKYEAAKMNRRALDGREKMLGKDHPDTLTSIYYLAILLHSQKKYDDASLLYQRTYAGYEKTLGLNHPTTIACSKRCSSMLGEIREG